MKRDDALKELKEEFSEVKEQPLSNGVLLVLVGPLPIVGGDQKTKVGMKLTDEISSVPEVFVETHVKLNTGGQPASAANIDVEGTPLKKWSFSTRWNPATHTISQLVYAVLSIFNR